MEHIENKYFKGERPLFARENLQLNNVQIGNGESALKEAKNIKATSCVFKGKYPFWHNAGSVITNSLFTSESRAAIWYCKHITIENTQIHAPKVLREIDGLYLNNVKLSDAEECTWYCRNIEFNDVEVNDGDYIFKNCENIKIDNLKLQGKYSFQYVKNVEIRNSHLITKDAFWNTENVTVYDSVIEGKYLGWYSKNLRLVNCVITGTQPLCYAENLILENCTMNEDADLAFENSTVHAEINGNITSVKNPAEGEIIAQNIGEIIIDENCKKPGACKITVASEAIA